MTQGQGKGESRTFSTAAIVSITTGTLFCSFAEMHEAAEWIMGHPIWTHHFASPQLCDEMKRTVLVQHPDLPSDSPDGCDHSNYLEHLAAIEARHGKTLRVARGGGLTAMLPTDGVPEHLKEKTVVIKTSAPGDDANG